MTAERTEGCLDEDVLLDLAEGRLGPAERRSAEQHLDGCSECRCVLAALARDDEELGDDTVTRTLPQGRAFFPGPLAERYQLIRETASDPRGVAYSARDRETGTAVRVRIVDAARVESDEALARALDALVRSKSLVHGNLLRVLRCETEAGGLVIVSEPPEGDDLGTFARSGALTPVLGREVALQLVAATAALHREGVWHGTLAPDAAFVDLSGNVRVTDFCLSLALKGAPARSPPEARRVDVQTVSRLALALLPEATAESASVRSILERVATDAAAFPSAIELEDALRRIEASGAFRIARSAAETDERWGPQPGDRIGKYRIEGRLGSGGGGVVLVAVQPDLDRRVAIKLMPPRASKRPSAVERFLREARTASAIESQNVVRVFDVGRTDAGMPYMVMEYLDGVTLRRTIATRGALPVGEAVDYLLQACVAVAECHARGIIHRDLKPENIMVLAPPGQRGLVKILDFGISKTDWLDEDLAPGARLTGTREVLGTPTHMSPEQVRSSKNVDQRSDIWSLGVVLYEALTGIPPFIADSLPALSAMIVSDEPTPPRVFQPELPAALEAVILECLAKRPDRRPPTVAALAERLRPFAPATSLVSVERIRSIAASELPRISSIPPAPERIAPPAPVVVPAAPAPTTTSWQRRVRPRALALRFGLAGLALVVLLGWVVSRLDDEPASTAASASATAEPLTFSPEPGASAIDQSEREPTDAGPTRGKRRRGPRSGPLDERY